MEGLCLPVPAATRLPLRHPSAQLHQIEETASVLWLSHFVQAMSGGLRHQMPGRCPHKMKLCLIQVKQGTAKATLY